jgi:hypothetical protein
MSDEEFRRKRAKGVSREELEKQYPSLSHLSGPPTKAQKRAWVAVFTARPDAMHNLLADYIKQVYATPGRIGQRPMPKEEAVDFQGLMYGEENDLPISEVLPKLVKVSERMFCQMCPGISRRQYQRILAGEYDPTVNELRAIAKAVKKPPTYFIEYRKAMAIAAFINLLEERPGFATTLYRQYLSVRG